MVEVADAVNSKVKERHIFVLRSGERLKERTLTPRGISHLEELGSLIKANGKPEFAVVSSLAIDAKKSAEIIANAIGAEVSTSSALTSGGLKREHADFMGGEVIYGIRIRAHGYPNIYADPQKVQAVLNRMNEASSIVLIFDAYPNMNNFLDFVGRQNGFNGNIGPMDNGYAMHIDTHSKAYRLLRYD